MKYVYNKIPNNRYSLGKPEYHEFSVMKAKEFAQTKGLKRSEASLYEYEKKTRWYTEYLVPVKA